MKSACQHSSYEPFTTLAVVMSLGLQGDGEVRPQFLKGLSRVDNKPPTYESSSDAVTPVAREVPRGLDERLREAEALQISHARF
jgi:hypothetical protein